MPINKIRDAQGRSRFEFEFSRRLDGGRVRARKLLPAAWNRTQADAFDHKESARLYAQAAGVQHVRWTIDQAVARYLDERVDELKHGRGTAKELALMRIYYEGKPLEQLPEVAAKYTADHRAKLAPATIMNRLRYLSAACRWGWKRHGMGATDPAARVIIPAVSNEKKVFLNRAQMLLLARCCESRAVRAMIRISFYSGMRLDEIRRARVEGGCWVLDDTKNGDPRVVPMHPRCRAYSSADWPSKGMVAYWMRKAVTAAGSAPEKRLRQLRLVAPPLPTGVTFHTLRHSAASSMIANQVDLYTVGAVLGHKSAASTRRYAHLATEALGLAVGKIGARSTSSPVAARREDRDDSFSPMEARIGVEPISTDLQSRKRA